MTKKDWEKVIQAKDILQLQDSATLSEIKEAYRRMSKKYHPDLAGNHSDESDHAMYEVTEAYHVLQKYCENYRYPLVVDDNQELEGEDWWMDRFGQDPLWGKKKKG
jgi:DnaJ-class molecular chaperone